MAREGSETAAQGEGSLWQDKPVALRGGSRGSDNPDTDTDTIQPLRVYVGLK